MSRLVYSRTHDNIERLAEVLSPFKPNLRGAPADLPFTWDAKTIRNGLNFTLTTTVGDIDLLGEVAGGDTYSDLLPHSSKSKPLEFTSNVSIFQH